MPSGFQMLDAYNSMKEQIINEESEHARSDQKVPSCFPESLKEEQDFKMSQGLPQNFLGGLHSGTLFLEEIHSPLSSSPPSSSPPSSQCLLTTARDAVPQYPGFLQYQTLSPTAAAALLNPTPSSATQQSPSPPTSSSSSSLSSSARRTPPMPAAAAAAAAAVGGSVPFFNLVAGGGCTFSPSPSSSIFSSSSSTSSITVPVSVGQRSPDHQLAPSPTGNLYDLDKDKSNMQSLYEDCPSLDSKVTIKLEPNLYQCPSEAITATPINNCNSNNNNNNNRVPEEDYYTLGEVGFGDQFLNLDVDRTFEDIFHLASQLNVSYDPSDWTYQDSQKWVRYQLGRAGSGVDPHHTEESVALFNVSGDILQRMTENDFQWRASEPGGSFLYRELYKWARAGKYLREHYHRPSAESDDYERDQDAAFYWVDPAYPMACEQQGHISPAPSLDSTCSGGSGSSGVGGGQSYGSSPYGMQMVHESSNEDEGFFCQDRTMNRQTFTQAHQQQHHHHLPHQHQTTLPTTTTHASFHNTTSPVPVSTSSPSLSSAAGGGGTHPAPSQGGPRAGGRHGGKQTIHLWQFLKELLEEPESYNSCIKWTDRGKGVFKIEDSSKVARLWGRRKNRPAMNYDKLSRSVRQYYKKGIIKKTEHSKRLVYQFCPGYL